MSAETQYSTPVTETLQQHVSIREYTKEAIPDGMLREILNSARRSPTSSNMQAYSLIVVKAPETKQKLAVLTGNQSHVATCPVFIAVCADTWRLQKAAEMHATTLAHNLENFLVASVDAALVGMSIATAAESFGLGHVMIGGIRNHPQDVAELLHLPDGVYVVYGICLGFPIAEEISMQKPRLPEAVVIHEEVYQEEGVAEHLAAHDAELAAHYEALGRNLKAAAWTGVIAERFSHPRRPDLKAALEAIGFKFE